MTDYTQAADALKRMAVQYKNIVAVADVLEQLGSVQNAKQEADTALAKARIGDCIARHRVCRTVGIDTRLWRRRSATGSYTVR